MHRDAVQAPDARAVQEKALLRIEPNLAYAEALSDAVDHRAVPACEIGDEAV
jgi:hypothetical protein